jgi:choline dehydrogenase-like flavoprotein
MFVDSEHVESGARFSADVVVIGAGAAGITLALQFLAEDRSVIVLESGGLEPDPDTQALYQGEVADETLHSPPHRYRQRRFGGSTTTWGGRCVPFDPADFDSRPWMPGSGWPFGYDELAPYYARANELCEAGEFAYTAEQAFPGGMRPMIDGYESRKVTTNRLERFSCPTDFGTKYRRLLASSPSVRVFLRANCTHLQCSADGGSIERVAVRTLTGRHFSIAGVLFILAAGGLEVPRLLLASRDVHKQGIGNDTDCVGRYYMCHIAGAAGSFTLKSTRSRVYNGYERSADGVYCRRRFAISDQAASELGIGNFVARLHHPHITDPSHRTGALSALYLARQFFSYEYGKRLRSGKEATWSNRLGHWRNVAVDPFSCGEFALTMLRKRVLAQRKFPSVIIRARTGSFSIDFHAEQQPNADSRVQLGERCDCLGMPQLRIDWRYTDLDVHTVTAALRMLADELARSGCGELHCSPDTLEEVIKREGAFGGHHIGTAKMNASRFRGVVDSNCRVHDTRNLFVASSAVFPTSSQANPTLTIVALALRLSEHLKRLLLPQALLCYPEPVDALLTRTGARSA